MSENPLYILTGPTAVGKTDLAIAWAVENDAEILSCDAFLVYKEMNIGTAKPTEEELRKVVHHGIDICSVDKSFSVKDYQDYALSVVKDVYRRNKKLLITGGSGFYLKCFYEAVIDNHEVDEEVTERVELTYDEKGLNGVLEELSSLNPNGLGNLDINNPRRVIKALERCLTLGKSLDVIKAEFDKLKSPFEPYLKKTCLLQRDKEDLEDRVLQRVKVMIDKGLRDETRFLIEKGLMMNPTASIAIGYRETILYLNDEISRREWEDLIVHNTMKLVKKQRKWFRHQLEADRVVNLSEETVKSLFDF